MQIVNLGTMAGTNVDAFVKNVRNTEEMPNGSFVAITSQVSGQPDLYVAATPLMSLNKKFCWFGHLN